MLTEQQRTDVWERQIKAEIRSLYFADLTGSYTKRKQAITFLSFFLSSGAAATLLGRAPTWVAIVLSTLAAVCTAYSVAIGLDRKVATLVKLYADWASLATDYEKLRNESSKEDAHETLSVLLQRDLEASKLGAAEAPYDRKRIDHWTDIVFEARHLAHA